MDNEPDLNFDIDALFAHLVGNLDHDIEDPQDWLFTLRSSDLNALKQVADELEEEFSVQIQEDVEEIDMDGNVTLGAPMLTVMRRDALTANDVKQIAERIGEIARQHNLTYEGVDCYDPVDEEELFGWLAPEDAGWRLRHMTDCGLPDNADLPWTFLVVTQSLDSVRRISTALDDGGFGDRDDYDEPDDEGNFAVCVFVQGRNNEIELGHSAERISKIAESNGGELDGIQFYTREDMAEIFAVDEEL